MRFSGPVSSRAIERLGSEPPYLMVISREPEAVERGLGLLESYSESNRDHQHTHEPSLMNRAPTFVAREGLRGSMDATRGISPWARPGSVSG